MMLPSPSDGDDRIESVVEPVREPARSTEGQWLDPDARRRFEAEFHEGPLPPPWQLREYESILPGSAERIISMAESSLDHGKSMDRSELGLARLGLVFGFALTLVGIGGGLFLAYAGKELSGFSAFFVSLATLVGLFLYDRKNSESGERSRNASLAAARSDKTLPADKTLPE